MRRNQELLEKLSQKTQLIHRKHSREISALETKIKTNWLSKWSQREREVETVRKKYKNAKNNLMLRYKQDWLLVVRQSPAVRMAIKEQISDFQS